MNESDFTNIKVKTRLLLAQQKGKFPSAVRGDVEWHGMAWVLPWWGISRRWGGGVAMFWGLDYWGAECTEGSFEFILVLFSCRRKPEKAIMRVS